MALQSHSKDAGNTIPGKRFPGEQLILTGANSAVGLRSMPARWVLLDKVDTDPGDVDGEGYPIVIAEAQPISFGHRSKGFPASTLTQKGLRRFERKPTRHDAALLASQPVAATVLTKVTSCRRQNEPFH